MNSINERIAHCIDSSGLTKTAFAQKIGLTQAYVSALSIGRKAPSDRTIADICREFNVNETWLRTGEGEMFRKRSRSDELAAYMEDLLQTEPEDIRRKFALAVSHLSTDQLILLKDIAESLVNDLQNTAPAVPDRTEADTNEQERPEPDLAAKVVELERKNQEKDKQLQELAAKVAAMEEEDAIEAAKSHLESAGSSDPAQRVKK